MRVAGNLNRCSTSEIETSQKIPDSTYSVGVYCGELVRSPSSNDQSLVFRPVYPPLVYVRSHARNSPPHINATKISNKVSNIGTLRIFWIVSVLPFPANITSIVQQTNNSSVPRTSRLMIYQTFNAFCRK